MADVPNFDISSHALSFLFRQIFLGKLLNPFSRMYLPTLSHGQDVTQGQFLSGV